MKSDRCLPNVAVTIRPSEADEFSILLKNNDIIIMATDGLFDNVTEKQILDVINSPNVSPANIFI